MAGKGAAPGERRGGRAKGVKNKATLDLIQTLNEKGYSPVAELIRIAHKAEIEYDRAAEVFDAICDKRASEDMIPLHNDNAVNYLKVMQSCAADLMPYVYPRRKAVEVTGADGENLFQSFADMVKRVADGARKDSK